MTQLLLLLNGLLMLNGLLILTGLLLLLLLSMLLLLLLGAADCWIQLAKSHIRQSHLDMGSAGADSCQPLALAKVAVYAQL